MRDSCIRRYTSAGGGPAARQCRERCGHSVDIGPQLTSVPWAVLPFTLSVRRLRRATANGDMITASTVARGSPTAAAMSAAPAPAAASCKMVCICVSLAVIASIVAWGVLADQIRPFPQQLARKELLAGVGLASGR